MVHASLCPLVCSYIHWYICTSSWGVLLATPLCYSSNNLHFRFLLRHMIVMPWVLLRWVISFKVEHPPISFCCMLVSHMVFAFCYQLTMELPCSAVGDNDWGLHCCKPSECTLQPYMLPLGCIPANDPVDSESVVGIKPGDYGVVIGYHIDKFMYTWLAACFIAWLHIYPGFTGKVSKLTDFLLEAECEDYSFWTKKQKTLNKFLILYSLALSKHQNWRHPLMRLILCLLQSLQVFNSWFVLFLIFLNCRVLLVSNLRNEGARLGINFFLYHRQAKFSLGSLLIVFQSSSCIWILGFFASW